MTVTRPDDRGAQLPLRRLEHEPVMLAEVLHFLEPGRGGWFVDTTLGLGGHAAALLAASPAVRLLGIDRDAEALARSNERLAPFADRTTLVQARFDELANILAERDLPPPVGILADLGVSSLQLDSPQRGFSFRFDGPLDMRMGDSDMTAADIVNAWGEDDLIQVLRENGEGRDARRIARAIVAARPIETTAQLRAVVTRAKRLERNAKIDPATLVFQALRIEVNGELDALDAMLNQATRCLAQDGRLVVISYHSLEDRIVKNRLRDLARGVPDQITGRPLAETQILELLTRKPVRPTPSETSSNPRARSGVLRAARRI